MNLLKIVVVAMVLLSVGYANARLDFAQIAPARGKPVCEGWNTGLDDLKTAEFHTWSRIINDGAVRKRIRIQRGSKITLRLLGHGADLATGVAHSKPGLTASLGAGGRYVNYPGASVPMGFKDIVIDARQEATKANVNIQVQWPLGSEIIPIRIVNACDVDDEPDNVATEDNLCFGALGMQCGIPIGNVANAGGALCVEGICLVNSGSWNHDECCTAHPGGVFCRGVVDGVLNQGDQNCRAAWDRATGRLGAGFNWHREVDTQKVNRDGKVVAADYCAPKGTIIHKNDSAYCCSAKGVSKEPSIRERNQSVGNRLVKGYTTAGPAKAAIPADGMVCQ